jgi:hypothetical protein
MKSGILPLLSTLALLTAPENSTASLTTWQAEVGVGTAPAATVFTTTSGASPVLVDVGALTGDRSFEFIYNAGIGGASQALMGTQSGASGAQGLKTDQWQNSGVYGITDFGIADHYSTITNLQNLDVHVVYTSNGVDTSLYLNGVPVFTFVNVDLTITGVNALGAASNPTQTAFFDNLAGNVLGFASYDSALSPAEVAAHYAAFVVPEPGVSGLALLAGLAALRRRR